jgi:microcystin-dependent protein
MPVFGGDTPVGAGMIWYTNTAPANWLICDGSAVSRTQYGALFSVLGTTYGTGNGSTTFNLPDLRQRFPMGKAASGTGNSLAGTGGAIDHTHSVPAHYHGMGTGADLNITSSGAHTHDTGNNQFFVTSNNTITVANGVQQFSNTAIVANTGSSSHTHASNSFSGRIGLVTGGVDGNAAMTSGTQNPPYLVVNYIIKAA